MRRHLPEQFTRAPQQFLEDLKGLVRTADLQAMTPRLAGVGIALEPAETADMRRPGIVHSSVKVVRVWRVRSADTSHSGR
jgi:hypothetical protein